MRSNADVVCLQEVMFTVFEDDLVPALRGLGYDGLMQNDRKRGDTHPQGVAIFWKRDKLSLSGECHRTRTMVAVLADSEDRRCAVVNCHLEGRPDKSVARVKQLQTTLAELVRKHPHHGLVVCGDFNCMLGSSACGAYLAFGAAAPGVLLPACGWTAVAAPRHSSSTRTANIVGASTALADCDVVAILICAERSSYFFTG